MIKRSIGSLFLIVAFSVGSVGAAESRSDVANDPAFDIPRGDEAEELNIICNDGTESPSCEVCRRGCCSHHGGCR